jgi:hypothetical protein
MIRLQSRHAFAQKRSPCLAVAVLRGRFCLSQNRRACFRDTPDGPKRAHDLRRFDWSVSPYSCHLSNARASSHLGTGLMNQKNINVIFVESLPRNIWHKGFPERCSTSHMMFAKEKCTYYVAQQGARPRERAQRARDSLVSDHNPQPKVLHAQSNKVTKKFRFFPPKTSSTT